MSRPLLFHFISCYGYIGRRQRGVCWRAILLISLLNTRRRNVSNDFWLNCFRDFFQKKASYNSNNFYRNRNSGSIKISILIFYYSKKPMEYSWKVLLTIPLEMPIGSFAWISPTMIIKDNKISMEISENHESMSFIMWRWNIAPTRIFKSTVPNLSTKQRLPSLLDSCSRKFKFWLRLLTLNFYGNLYKNFFLAIPARPLNFFLRNFLEIYREVFTGLP